MTRPEASRQFEMRIDIAAPRDAVWRALTDDRELARWFAPAVAVEPGVGGRVQWEWPGAFVWPLRIEVWEPLAHLRTSYASGVDDGRGGKLPLLIDFELSGTGGTTMLRLVHHGFGPQADFDAEYDGIRGGWPTELGSLRLYLERHRSRERLLAWSHTAIASSVDEGWRALCGSRGLGSRSNIDGLKAGDSFTIALEGADPIEAHVLQRSATFDGVSAVAENLNDGFLHFWVEPGHGTPRAWLWLALYDAPRAQVERFQRAFDATLQRLFAARSAELRA